MKNFINRCKITWAIMPNWAKGADMIIVTGIMAYIMIGVF